MEPKLYQLFFYPKETLPGKAIVITVSTNYLVEIVEWLWPVSSSCITICSSGTELPDILNSQVARLGSSF